MTFYITLAIVLSYPMSGWLRIFVLDGVRPRTTTNLIMFVLIGAFVGWLGLLDYYGEKIGGFFGTLMGRLDKNRSKKNG